MAGESGVTIERPLPVSVPLSEIRFDQRAWPREYLDAERVEDFAALFTEGGPEFFRPIELVPCQPGRFLIADGTHRVEAARKAGLASLPALLVSPPADLDPVEFAYRYALSCSSTSALPLTRAEKRRAVRRLLDANPQASDREIGRLVGVDHKTVGRVRRGTSPRQSATLEFPALGAAPEAVAKKLFRAFEKVYEARGLGVADFFVGDRTGERLAAVFDDVYGERALEKTEQFLGWLDSAAKALRKRPG
jgi:hypothetical protein